MPAGQEKQSKDSVLDLENGLLTRSTLKRNIDSKFNAEPPSGEQDEELLTCTAKCVSRMKRDVAPVFTICLKGYGLVMFAADIATDALVAKHHYENNHKTWFALTCVLIILPSIIIQIFSCKWFIEDTKTKPWWMYLVHCLQLGAMYRLIREIRLSFRTRSKTTKRSDYKCYLEASLDNSFLRLFEGFLEAAPQLILQLYILTTQGEFTIERDWQIVISVTVSIISLSSGVESYSEFVRSCLSDCPLPLVYRCIKILYRFLIIASRVTVIVLFTSAFKYYIFLVIVCHSLLMFVWLSWVDEDSSSTSTDRESKFLRKIYLLVISIINIFCFFNIHLSRMRQQISVYYIATFIETAILMVSWYLHRTLEGAVMYAAVGIVFGGFIVGLTMKIFYYWVGSKGKSPPVVSGDPSIIPSIQSSLIGKSGDSRVMMSCSEDYDVRKDELI